MNDEAFIAQPALLARKTEASMKLTAQLHGIIDYATVLLLWLSPSLVPFAPFTANFTYTLGGVHLVLTLLTKFPLGVIKLILFSLHGKVELLVSIVLAAVSVYLFTQVGTVDGAFYLVFAGVVFGLWKLTDYTA
jgi:hypothetical protein